MGTYLKIFVDSLDKYRKLNDAEFGRLIRAALTYKATGVEVELMGREELLWDGLKLDIDRENENYASVVATRSEAGKKGASARWEKEKGNSKSHFENGKNGKSHLPYGKNGQDKDKDKDKDKENIPPYNPPTGGDRVSYSVDFERFYAEYPRQVGKKPAYTAWKKLKPDKSLLEKILEGLSRWKASEDWTRNGGQFVCYPQKFLNARMWEDFPTPAGGAPTEDGEEDDFLELMRRAEEERDDE